MPFAATIQKVVSICSGVRMYEGTWTGNAGDANGTLTVGGGVAWITVFTASTSGEVWEVVPVSQAAGATDGTVTLTIYNKNDVTAGRFMVLSSG